MSLLFQTSVRHWVDHGPRVTNLFHPHVNLAFRCLFSADAMVTSGISKSLRVLVVDDEKTIADSLVSILSRSGFDASAVYSGEAAQDEARSLKPDVLVCDVMMTGISGVDAALQIRRFLPNCRVIFISGRVNTIGELIEHTTRLPLHFEFLSKPFHPLELIARLNERGD